MQNKKSLEEKCIIGVGSGNKVNAVRFTASISPPTRWAKMTTCTLEKQKVLAFRTKAVFPIYTYKKFIRINENLLLVKDLRQCVIVSKETTKYVQNKYSGSLELLLKLLPKFW